MTPDTSETISALCLKPGKTCVCARRQQREWRRWKFTERHYCDQTHRTHPVAFLEGEDLRLFFMPSSCCNGATDNWQMDRRHADRKAICNGVTDNSHMDHGHANRKRARMEDDSQRCNQWASRPFDVPQSNGKKAPDYLKWVSGCVSTNKDMTRNLKKPAGSTWRIGDVDDTIYKEDVDEVDGWGKFYLPDEVSMQVIGVVEGTSCPCEQLVLMTCEDRKVYAYDGEDLHEVASSLRQVWDEGIEYPASRSYYDGEAFKDMREEDWAKVKEGPVGKSLDQEHHQLVTASKSRFLENLKSIRPCTGVIS